MCKDTGNASVISYTCIEKNSSIEKEIEASGVIIYEG